MGRTDGALDYEQGEGGLDESRRRRVDHRRRAAVGTERNLYDFAYDQGFAAAADRQSQP